MKKEKKTIILVVAGCFYDQNSIRDEKKERKNVERPQPLRDF